MTVMDFDHATFDLRDPALAASLPSFSDLLSAGVEKHAERILVVFEGGEVWTWAQAQEHAQRMTGRLRALGCVPGDRIGLFLSNGPEFLSIWWGAALLGGILSPYNTALRGRLLIEVCETADPKIVFIGPSFREQKEDLQAAGVPVMDVGELASIVPDEAAAVSVSREGWMPHALIFTSGTTGRSKGSLASFAQIYSMTSHLVSGCDLTPEDRLLVDLPLSHLAAVATTLTMLIVGGSIAVRNAPAMSRYWEAAAETGVTFAIIVGTMAEFLLNQPLSPFDRSHKFRFLMSSPLPSRVEEFKERFGIVGFATGYGSTETGTPLFSGLSDAPVAGTCGRLRDGLQARLVDENDFPVAPGEAGELILRSEAPWIMSLGYYRNAEATAEAWRNGWFHTGDNMTRDLAGYYFFKGRTTDSLRRRGENISSFEVEREVLTYPGIMEAACVPVRGNGDDEVKVFLVLRSQDSWDYEALHRYLVGKMPHFMVPRYYEVIGELPKTATARVRKFELVMRGNGASTWDSEAAGLRVTRSGLAR